MWRYRASRSHTLASGIGFSSLAQKSARHPQCSLGRLDINRLREHQIRPHAIGLRDADLSFDKPNGKRPLIEWGVARALEHQGRALLILTVDDDCVIVLRHQTFYRRKRINDGRNGEFELAEKLAYDPGKLLISAEK